MSDTPERRAPIPVTPARQVPEVTQDNDAEQTVTVFMAVGGQPFFDDLVAGFYRRVADDPVLLPLYPDAHDLGPAADRLAKFLAQYWGGPTTYAEERGNPALKMRHFPYSIGPVERDHWMAAMRAAVDELDPIPQARIMLMDYFTMAAEQRVEHPRLGYSVSELDWP